MTTTRRSFLKTIAGGTAAAGAGAWRPRVAPAATAVKVGCVVLGDMGINAPTMIALEKGYFKQNDLDAEMIPFKGGPDLLKGVLAGGADIGLTGATDPLVVRERGTGIRAIATILEKNHFTLTVTPKIKKVEDLKGGSIGVTVVGSTTWVFARMLAR
ncbi:MAG TPA: ABC transporter substrate-binding protein, partial [Methylomirabilota bacterium]